MKSKTSQKNKYILPIGLALIGLASTVALTIVLLRKQDEEEEGEQDIENYDTRNAPLL